MTNHQNEDTEERLKAIKQSIDAKESDLAAYRLGYQRLQESSDQVIQQEHLLDVEGVGKAFSQVQEQYESILKKERDKIDLLEEDYWRIQKNGFNQTEQ